MREYALFVELGMVPEVTVPLVPKRFSNEHRIKQLIDELYISKAELLITLGDIPLREFVAQFEPKWKRLAHFGQTPHQYGRIHEMKIEGQNIGLIPLVHPCQAGRLGASSNYWGNLHDYWVKQKSGS